MPARPGTFNLSTRKLERRPAVGPPCRARSGATMKGSRDIPATCPPLRRRRRHRPGRGIKRTRRVFVNRDLRMTGAAWVGFDMDYTLAIYDQPEMDQLSIQATVEKLIKRGYPEHHRRHPVSTRSFPIRGLLIDKRFGHILKMDRYKYVQQGLPRHARALEGRAPRALPVEEDPPDDAALPLDRHALRAQRGGALRGARRRVREARATRSTTRGSSPTSASASTRRTATAPSSTR